MSKVEQNTMVPYESIDPAGAAALKPGVSFLVSKNTMREVLVRKGLSSSKLMAGASGLANHIERAFATLQAADISQAWEAYGRMCDVLRAHYPQAGWNDNEEKKRAAELISALSEREVSSRNIELAFSTLNTRDERRACDLYLHIGEELMRAHIESGPPNFSSALAARLSDESVGERRTPSNDNTKTDTTAPSPAASRERE